MADLTKARDPDEHSGSQRPRILLTGANGQLGRELCHSLKRLGEVIALTRQELDLRDPVMIRSVVRAQKPAFIINTAAYTAVDQAESEPSLAHRINAIAPGVLAEEAKRLNVPLIHYSTDYVFDGEKSHPYDERDASRPRNAYGDSKRAGEQAVQASGCRHLIFRTSWLYSEHGKNFVTTMLNLSTRTKTVRVVHDQCGAPTWVRTVAESTTAIVANYLISSSDQDDAQAAAWWLKHAGIYHMCAGGQTTWSEFAAAVFALRGIDCTVVPITSSEYPTPAQRPRNSCLSNEKLMAVFGVRLPPWQQTLALFLSEMKANAD